MKKRIKIGNKEFDIKSSAYTMFGYKDFTGRDLMSDINKINRLHKKTKKMDKEKQQEYWLSNFNSIFNLCLEMAYTLVLEANDKTPDFKTWLKSIDDLMADSKWISEVLEVGMSPFRGRVQKN